MRETLPNAEKAQGVWRGSRVVIAVVHRDGKSRIRKTSRFPLENKGFLNRARNRALRIVWGASRARRIARLMRSRFPREKNFENFFHNFLERHFKRCDRAPLRARAACS
jgi:hypothetical protein